MEIQKNIRKKLTDRPIQYSKAEHPRDLALVEVSKAVNEQHWMDGIEKTVPTSKR